MHKFGSLIATYLRKRADMWEEHPYRTLGMVVATSIAMEFIKDRLKSEQ